MLKFYKVKDIEVVADFIATRIKGSLEDKKVLWLLPGGSAISVAALAAMKLSGNELKNLTAAPYDERYGRVGHGNSNWQQLIDAGLNLPGATLKPILIDEGIDKTLSKFADSVKDILADNDYKIGLFGIGSDGHIAGILPGSPAVRAKGLVTSYKASDYERLTVTFETIKQLDTVIVYAVGDAKHSVLNQLDEDLSLDVQPAQILKQVKEAIIFNDYRGDEL